MQSLIKPEPTREQLEAVTAKAREVMERYIHAHSFAALAVLYRDEKPEPKPIKPGLFYYGP